MSQSKHDKVLDKLVSSPNIVIPGRLYWSAKETNFYNKNGNMLCQPDFMAYTRSGDLYIVEYKGTDSGKSRRKADVQLEKAKRFVEEMGFNGRIEKLYIGDKK